MEFENHFINFKGNGYEKLQKFEVIRFLTDLFDAALYKKIKLEERENVLFKSYNTNQEFWNDCLSCQLYDSKTIKLENFCILEWLPYSPGLYYTDRAIESRRLAKYMMSEDKNEFLPLGKTNMMLGGVGSVRLTSENGKYYLNASSTGTSHQGIPIIVNKETYNTLIDEVKQDGYCTADIIGTIEVLPISKAIINYAREIPKYSLVVTSVKKKSKKTTKILVSVSAIYSDDEQNSYQSDKYWSFASFTPDSKEIELKKAVNWIEQYAKRYTKGSPKILSDFDEHKSHFNTDIEFKLQNIVNGTINEELLLKYFDKLKITINKKIMGDYIENNSGNIIKSNTGSVIVSTSGNITLSDSFNKVKEKYGEDIASTLTTVADILKKEKNNDAIEKFNTFKEELEKPTPKKTILKALWDGIASTIPLIKSSFDIYDKVKDFIT